MKLVKNGENMGQFRLTCWGSAGGTGAKIVQIYQFVKNIFPFWKMEVSSLSRLCLESTADNMAMWCESALKEDFFKYMYAIGPFNGLSKGFTVLIIVSLIFLQCSDGF